MKTEGIEAERYMHQSLPTPRDIFAILFRHWKAMLVAVAIIVMATVVAGIWTPKYEAKMKILVQSKRSDAVVSSSSITPVQFSGNQVSEEDLNSEAELLTGDDLLRKVVLATGLGGQHGVPLAPSDDVGIANAVSILSHDLKVEAIRKTHVISIRYKSRDPRLASAVLNALATAYIEKHTEVHRPTGEFKFFDQQAEQFHEGLEQAQQKLTAFSMERGVVSAQLERDSALQRANEFESNARQAQATVAETEQRISALQQQLQSVQPRMTTSKRTSDNQQLLGQLKSTLLTLQLKKTELLTKYDPGYRLVQEVDKQIADTNAAITAEQSAPVREETTDQNPNYQLIREELTKDQTDLSGLRARESSAKAIAAQYRESARNLDQDSIIQQNLLRDAKTQEDGYLLYMHKSEEAGISDALDRRGILNVAIAEQSVVPGVPTRSPLIAAMFTLVLAFAGSISTAFVIDLMDPSFRTPDELAGYLQTPVLAALPKGRG